VNVRAEIALRLRPQAEDIATFLEPPQNLKSRGIFSNLVLPLFAGEARRTGAGYIGTNELLGDNSSHTAADESSPLLKVKEPEVPIDEVEEANRMNVFEDRQDRESDFRGSAFQRQINKFQRILAHLVNERTILAWFRTNLAFITLSFKYMNLGVKYDDDSSEYSYSAAVMLFITGGLFMAFLPISWHYGYTRFEKCKDMLDYDITKISGYLYKMGFDVDNAALGALIYCSFFAITISSTIIIWFSSASSDD
jgi:uncharacterized membrane protein YidH (DUF202 family)